ncbi:GerW family sporulation protein [Pseudoflavonifractor sp. HCP28S3_F10]|uniref:GerW family sporulation protein n=1 Tax=Pseudoflavonifractor sp. HCP28S3_F10 TaxID=3438947 RepID=UPI002A8BEA1C|nr:GerW family sporulation protein [Clostridiales bacterium]MDY4180667.1 GerW family sporulation protein [Pseudoflavonifractor sp.]
MENKHPIGDLMSTTMQKIREMVDVNTVIGTPIETQGITIIPVSKVSVGFATGGSDFATKQQKPDAGNAFGGGGGASVKITPMSFLIVKGDSVRLLPVDPPAGNTVDRVVEMVPELVDKVTGFIDQQKAKKAEETGSF